MTETSPYDVLAECENCSWTCQRHEAREDASLHQSVGEDLTVDEAAQRRARNHERVYNGEHETVVPDE